MKTWLISRDKKSRFFSVFSSESNAVVLLECVVNTFVFAQWRWLIISKMYLSIYGYRHIDLNAPHSSDGITASHHGGAATCTALPEQRKCLQAMAAGKGSIWEEQVLGSSVINWLLQPCCFPLHWFLPSLSTQAVKPHAPLGLFCRAALQQRDYTNQYQWGSGPWTWWWCQNSCLRGVLLQQNRSFVMSLPMDTHLHIPLFLEAPKVKLCLQNKYIMSWSLIYILL